MTNEIEKVKKEKNRFPTPAEIEAIGKKLMAGDPEYKKIRVALQSEGKAFATKFRIKMFDVLTDEQWARLQKLVDDPPEHAKTIRKKLKAESDEADKKEAWTPGPNSWRPGDPVPEEYRQQRNERRGRFPRGESE
jgi:hypothetical protein